MSTHITYDYHSDEESDAPMLVDETNNSSSSADNAASAMPSTLNQIPNTDGTKLSQPEPASSSECATLPAVSSPSVPLSILTGWLGAGKTTLMRRILSHFHSLQQRVAIIQNEASAFGVEQALSIEKDDTGNLTDLLELGNGCVCCSVKTDFILGVEALLSKRRFDYIVLECSGLADPGPIASLFWVDPELESKMYLDGIITVVDASNFLNHIRTTEFITAEEEQRIMEHTGGDNYATDYNTTTTASSTAVLVSPSVTLSAPPSLESAQVIHQLAYADRILLNKIDLVSPSEQHACIRSIRKINSAPVHLTVRSEVTMEEILHIRAFDCNDMSRAVLPNHTHSDLIPALESTSDEVSHPHDRSIRTLVIDDLDTNANQRRDVDPFKLKQWMAELLWEEEKDQEQRTSESDVSTTAAPSSASAVVVSSSSSSVPPPRSCSTRSNELFRVKAIIALSGHSEPTFLQAVQQLYDIQPGDAWPSVEPLRRDSNRRTTDQVDQNPNSHAPSSAAAAVSTSIPPSSIAISASSSFERFTRFVFIGRRLDEQQLRSGFEGILI